MNTQDIIALEIRTARRFNQTAVRLACYAHGQSTSARDRVLVAASCTELRAMRDAEQEAFDALPESLQQAARGLLMEEVLDSLDDAIETAETAADRTEEAEKLR